ncbi:MAG: PleD family two-component system response regulator [Beijerinckiaceae bacterium]|nr:PleD family two-component system response regulator [Beijerinckiaceae bacterium]
MSGRVLVVDDLVPNVKLLEARLSAEYLSVVTAMNGPSAIEICERGECDMILLDVMMPGMDGFEVCRYLKNSPRTAHLPIVMVTALDQPSDRVKGLESGADDFLTKPVNDVALLARVRSLLRLKFMTDELRTRAGAGDALEAGASPTEDDGLNGKILLVDDRQSSVDRICRSLQAQHFVVIESDPTAALINAPEGDFDLAIISMALEGYDALRLCGQLRAIERTRHLPILVLSEPDDERRVIRALDLGVNDYLIRPIDRLELLARARTQIRRRRYSVRLRESMQESMAMAVTDPLTNLYNRRYLTSHLATLMANASGGRGDLCLLILDVDYFKRVNDSHGHDAGDEVLREFAQRLKKAVRGIDLVCRYGGEEFVVLMPDTDSMVAFRVAERIRTTVAMEPFQIHRGQKTINVTVSIGLGTLDRSMTSPNELMKSADMALYRAKNEGRNRVVAHAA